jgi:hypothetical protein
VTFARVSRNLLWLGQPALVTSEHLEPGAAGMLAWAPKLHAPNHICEP